MKPTAEQQAVIEHSSGHALVFAVAGSGKTTTMIERILHLIRGGGVRPQRILACTFTRAATRVIQTRLAEHPETRGVNVCTLHALAFKVVQEAQAMGYTEVRIDKEGFSRRLFEQARQQMIDEQQSERNAFYNIHFEDFQTYMSTQKGGLALPHIPDDLPDWARRQISEPDRGVELYADLYERHDELRRNSGMIDFDDTLVEAWLLLARFPRLLEVMQGKWDFVNVDEYQDVNLAQSEMLDLLTQKALSYVAIGDDDQTVYQWRGANPRFILGFSKRYAAQEFRLSTNFRCPMGVIALADQVISQNTVRAPKRLRASRGGQGVFLHANEGGLAAQVAIDAVEQGHSARDIVILVRTYAQTGEIEQEFIKQGVPYVIVGSSPFYERPEVKVLLAYLKLAMADLDVQRETVITPERRRELIQDWMMIANVPNRYLRRDVVIDVTRGVWQEGRTLSIALQEAAKNLRFNAQQHVESLSDALSDLTDDLALSEGRDALLSFANAIEYADHLVRSAPNREFGEERAGSIRALAQMAASRSLGEMLDHIILLTSQGKHVDRFGSAKEDEDRITIMTPFRAKGLEWSIVIVPGCSQGLYRLQPSADMAVAEEERRVFYVALTRTKKELHLLVDGRQPTEFLKDVDHSALVHGHNRLSHLLGRDPAGWSGADTLEAAELLQRYGHEHYVQLWLDGGYRERLLRRIHTLQEVLVDKLQWGQDVVEATLSLKEYESHGQVSLAEDETLGEFLDLDQLARTLNKQYRPGKAEQESATSPASGYSGLVRSPAEIKIGMLVRHDKLGVGQVIGTRVTASQFEVEVKFEGKAGTKRLVLAYVKLQHVRPDREEGDADLSF